MSTRSMCSSNMSPQRIDGLNAEIEELTAQLHAQASYEEEPMDMDAAFAEPPMAQPEEDRDAESAQALSADEKDERIAELERKLAEQENDASVIANALVTAQRSAKEVIDAANSEAKRIKSDAEADAAGIIDRANAEKEESKKRSKSSISLISRPARCMPNPSRHSSKTPMPSSTMSKTNLPKRMGRNARMLASQAPRRPLFTSPLPQA